MNAKELSKIRHLFFSSRHIKEIILAMKPKVYDENKPEYANAILFFRSISANADEMARLKNQLNTYEEETEMVEIGDKYKSPYGDHEWQEGYGIWESGFKRGTQWMLEKAATEFAANMRYEGFLMGAQWITEKAADWIEKYLGADNTIEDWYRDSKVLKNGREAFFKDMKE